MLVALKDRVEKNDEKFLKRLMDANVDRMKTIVKTLRLHCLGLDCVNKFRIVYLEFNILCNWNTFFSNIFMFAGKNNVLEKMHFEMDR